jgi:hypothetical protein
MILFTFDKINKIMKKYSHLAIFATILMISCQNTNKTNSTSQRFSPHSDTFYKVNSTDIESVTTTIYRFDSDTSNRRIELEQSTEDNLLVMFLSEINGGGFTAKFESPDLFKKFIKDARTVSNNPNKRLEYTFGYSEYRNGDAGSIFPGTAEGTIRLVVGDFGIDIAIAEVDSMESWYNRFLSEKK